MISNITQLIDAEAFSKVWSDSICGLTDSIRDDRFFIAAGSIASKRVSRVNYPISTVDDSNEPGIFREHSTARVLVSASGAKNSVAAALLKCDSVRFSRK